MGNGDAGQVVNPVEFAQKRDNRHQDNADAKGDDNWAQIPHLFQAYHASYIQSINWPACFGAGILSGAMVGFQSMFCENCHQNSATVHLTQIVNGKVEKHHFCEACAAEKGVNVHGQPMDLGGMLETLKEQLSQLKETSNPGRVSSRSACSGCGTARAAILKTGRMGCDQCYVDFASEMLPVIVSLHRSDQHLGKVPHNASVRLRNSVELARLRRELDQAVATENYEKAAVLRDQIQSLPHSEPPL